MSSWSGGGKRRTAGKGWRAQSDKPGELSHSWQSQGSGRVRSPRRRWQSHWMVYSVLGAALLGLFLYVLLIRPAKTPILLAAGVEYAAPVPPNAWVQEDRDALASLDETLDVADITGTFDGAGGDAWKSFQSLLSEHRVMRRGFRRVSEPLVIYFSMPGVVDEQGAPCLLPPGVAPLDGRSWLRVADLIDEIAKTVPPERQKLLVLDSNQTLINWQLGVVYNTFTERLKKLVSGCDVPNLAVLNSADAGQVSWCSPQLGGTAFGQFLQMGLAGAADYESADPNGEVSLVELTAYLRKQVDSWALANRDARQTPVLLRTADDLDFNVTHALSRGTIEQHRKTLADVSKIEPTVSIADMTSLWAMLDRLRELDLVRYDPLVLARHEGDLLRMERMAYGGQAYRSEAERLFRDLKTRFQQALDRADNSDLSLADQWGIANPDDAASARITPELRSLPLRQYFGQSTLIETKQAEEFLQSLVAAVNGLKEPQGATPPALVQALSAYPETQMLVAAHRLHVGRQTNSSQYLRAVIDLRKRVEHLAVPSLFDKPLTTVDAPAGSEERTALPGDERAHYFVRLAMAEVDRNRRLAEDALFVASPEAERRDLLSREDKSLAVVEDVQVHVSGALATADRALAQLPYLAEWISRDRGLTYPMADTREMDDLLRLVRDTHELGTAAADLHVLGQAPDKVAAIANRLKVMAQTIDQRLLQHTDEFKGVCDQLGKAQVGAELRSFEAVLASPLINASLRKDLLAKRDALAAELHKKFFTAEVESAGADESDAPGVAESIADWQQLPLLAILQLTSGQSVSEDPLARLEGACWAVRNSLRDLRELNVQGAASVDIASGNDAFLNDRQALSHAERRIRAAAALCVMPPTISPITRLRLFDLQQLLIWHANRALDDFWHTLVEVNAKTIQELLAPPIGSRVASQPAGFAETASAYLKCAELITAATQGVSLQISGVKRLADERLLASQFGIEQVASSRPVLDAPTDVEIDVEVAPHPKGSNLPVGTATIYVADQGNQLVDVAAEGANWGHIPLPFAAGETVRQIARARDVKESSLDSIVFFRGRQYRQSLAVNSLGGAVVQYELPHYDTQSITLFGDQPNPPSVIFILDCSYSMEARIETEVRGAPLQPQMKVAKTALETMLDELAGRQGAPPRVGVWFFGHRVGWFKDSVRVNRNPAAAEGPIPNHLAPAEDVEEVLPLGVFGAQEFGTVSKRLARVTYHGLTPVNLSIVRALEKFTSADDNYSKSIIVITDGENDQWHDTKSGFKPVRETTTEDVIKAWQRLGKNIPIYIIGFGIPADERGNAIREFQKIAKISHGKVVTPSSGADLIDYLRKQLSVQGYTVQAVDGERTIPVNKDEATGEARPVELNTRVVISSGDFELPAQFAVDFQSLSERVTLEGGEALEMRVARDGNDIGGVPYDADVIDEAPLVEGASDVVSSPIVRVHRPRRSNDRVKFRFSVQDQDAAFTPRPKEIWIEVVPEGSTNAYVYYDAVFEANTPVPVVGFSAANWPADTDYARVKFWCGYQPTATLLTIRLTDIPATEARNGVFQAVPQAPGVQVRVDLDSKSRNEFTVLVEEQFAEDAATSEKVRVGLEIADRALRPRMVSHRLDVANRVARHQFEFRTNLSRREFAERVAVAIVSEHALKQNCLRLGDANGLRVPIIDEDATLVPSAASASN